MGLEEVSETIDLIASKCHLELCKPNMKDASASGKESFMKTNGKKRTFALLLCVMMIVSAIGVSAAFTQVGYGTERAECYLDCFSTNAVAQTIPTHQGNTVSTYVVIRSANGNFINEASGSTYAKATRVNNMAVAYAESTHRINTFYATLTEYA